jgi:DNA-binding LacI/PurR family transcriptional regulator
VSARSARAGSGVTLDEIAGLIGVSRATVSNAYNRPDQLSPALRERILEVASALGYPGPDPAARSLRRGVAASIGVVLTETLSYAFSDLAAIHFLHGLARTSEAASVSLLLVPGSPRHEASAVRGAIVDGFIAYSMPDGDSYIEAIRGRQLPAVYVDSPLIPGANFVGVDNHSATREIAAHVFGLGHRSVAVVSFPCRPDGFRGQADLARQQAAAAHVTRERLAGYREAAEAAGIRWSEIWVEERTGSLEAEGVDAGLALLRPEPRPTAIIAMSDHLAIGVLQAALSLGMDVPGDLTIVGFDDIAAAALVRPALTTVRQPLEEKGAVAGELLIDSIATGTAAVTRLLPTELVIRQSAAPPRTA